LALISGKQFIPDAKDAFRSARRISGVFGIVKRTLKLFDELAKADTKGVLVGIRAVIEGNE
jgi:hypothetical protein